MGSISKIKDSGGEMILIYEEKMSEPAISAVKMASLQKYNRRFFPDAPDLPQNRGSLEVCV